MKKLADDNFKFNRNGRKVSKQAENTVCIRISETTSIGLFHPIKYFVTASKIVTVNSLDGTGESCNIDTLRVISTPKWVISSPHTILKKKEVQDMSK